MHKSQIPRELLIQLNEKGYTVEVGPPLDVGAEKWVYNAEYVEDDQPIGAVLLYSKKVMERSRSTRWAWNFERELELFRALEGKEHENIIRMLDFIGPSASHTHGPCMVLEKIEPLGFDVFKVVKQYQGACERTLPVAQWLHYLDQIIKGVKHLHELGWGHCDIKPDNVLVGDRHEVKIIDFGMAKKLHVDRHPGVFALYAPPEFAQLKKTVSESADAWLIGAMMFVVFAQMQVAFRTGSGQLFQVTDHRDSKTKGVCQAIRQWWGKEVDPIMAEAIDGLLQRDPKDRWTIEKLEEWCAKTKGDLHNETEYKPLPGKDTRGPTASLFSKAPPLDRLVKAFGLQVREDSELVGKYIGSHFKDGVPIKGPDKVVDFRKFAGATVLFIDRHPQMVRFPGAQDQVFVDDWIYIMIHEDVEMTDEHLDMHEKAQEARKDGVEIWLEFDWFEFPEHCVGATLADIKLGMQFGINAHFVARPSRDDEASNTPGSVEDTAEQSSAIRFVEVNAQTRIHPGDRALVCRVPDRDTGRSHSILSDEVLSPLFDESIFRERLNLTDEGAWNEWKGKNEGISGALESMK